MIDTFISNTPQTTIWAMMAACLLPFIFTWIAKVVGGFQLTDNENPRQFLNRLTGIAERAHAVQQNSFETLPMFLASVITALFFFVPYSTINSFAWMYVFIRVIYGIAYLLNLAVFRSILWTLSMACIGMLFYITLRIS